MGRTQMEAELATEPEPREITTDAEEALVLLQALSGVLRRLALLNEQLTEGWFEQMLRNIDAMRAQVLDLRTAARTHGR